MPISKRIPAFRLLLTLVGIETKILELDWSSFAASKDPSVQNEVAVSMPTAFETHARRLRFQALGKACRERKTETLLLGHHADDSVETTIWRLSAGARGPGLAGIPEMARIPECHGIFGVSESGSSITLPAEADASSSRVIVRLEGKNRGTISFVPDDQKPSFASIRMTQNPSSIATGGIFLCRPLLSFHKESLVATCKENNVPFVDDPTNFDPTLTVRNAIRSLLSSNSLPRALQPPSVLSLIRSNQSLLQFSHELTNQLLHNQCHILELNPRAGTMIIEFTQHTTWEDSSEFSSPSRRQQIQCMALRRITEILSPAPTNRYPLQSFESYISRVFHDHNDSGCPDSTSQSDYLNTRRPFTVGGVMFNPLTVKLASKTSKDGSSLERNIWLLSRQPFMKNRETELRVNVPIPNPPLSAKSTTSPTFTPWTLWDDRFWLRFSIVPKPVRNLDESALPKIDKIPLIIRPFQKADLERIRTDPGTLAGQDGSKNWRRVQPLAALIANQTRNLLASHAPGLTRFTIPILALGGPSDPGQTDDADSEHLLALPTIGHHLSGRRAKSERMNPKKLEMFYAGRWWVVEWEWMYKMIDTEALHLMGKSIEAGAYGTHEKI